MQHGKQHMAHIRTQQPAKRRKRSRSTILHGKYEKETTCIYIWHVHTHINRQKEENIGLVRGQPPKSLNSRLKKIANQKAVVASSASSRQMVKLWKHSQTETTALKKTKAEVH